jgi:hypothetical protein
VNNTLEKKMKIKLTKKTKKTIMLITKMSSMMGTP